MAGRGWVIDGGLQFFSENDGIGMLNMRFVQKIGGLVFLGYHKKNDCYYNDFDKRIEELSGPSDLCSTFKSLAVAFGKTFTLVLKFDLNRSADQMKVGSTANWAPSTLTRIIWDPSDILNILKWTNYSICFKMKASKMSQSL